MMRTQLFLLASLCILFRSALAAGKNSSNRTLEEDDDGVVFSDCHPEKGGFLCKSQHECISSAKACNGVDDCSDGSDEFPNCDKSCKKVTCEHACTPRLNPDDKGICYCPAGFQVSGIGKSKCINLNECELWGTCSQLCDDVDGSFKCSCTEGFQLQRNNATCLPEDPMVKIIFALKSSVRVITMNTSSQTQTIHPSPGQPIGVTFDASREIVYWTDVTDKMEAIYSAKLDGSDVKTIVDTGIVLLEGIAFDWVAGNIYFTDSNLTHIGVCDKDGTACTILVQEQMDKPREIVLHPSIGKMYWTDWGTVPSILSAGMDGSTPLPIVTENLKWPNGLAIDHANSRLYWVDAQSDIIETTKLDGDDRRTIRTTGVRHPFSMDIFGDTIYWSDWTLRQIQSCNKFTGNDHHILYSSSREQINGVAVYHPAAQSQNIPNPCATKSCSHICVLTPTSSSRCLCPVGMILDRRTCKDDPTKAKLFIANGNTVKQMHFHSIGNNVLFGKTIEGLHTIGAIAYNPLNKTFILFDTFRKNICSYNSTSHKLEILVSRHLGSVKGISIDHVARNLYWVDAEKKTVEVMSLDTGARAIAHQDEDETIRPLAIIAVPEVQSLFVSYVGRKTARIMKISMNTDDIHVLATISDGEPTSLAYQHEYDHIFWSDARKGTIEHVSLDGDVRFMAVAKANNPLSIALYGNRLYWTDLHSPLLYSLLLNTALEDSPMFIGNVNASLDNDHRNFFAYIGVMENDLSQSQDMIDSHECSIKPGKCSHICLISTEKEGTCLCPDGLEFSNDDETECVPLKKCFQNQFTCNDGSCISLDSKCDKFRDCPGGEDENNCTASSESCRVSDFVCKSDNTCISGPWHCDGEADCHDESDEKDCPDKPCPHSGDFKCKLGRCIPQSWRCDHVVDCPDMDHSDEDGCNFNCSEGEFKCGASGGHDCIASEWVCDGEPDCVDGSDEPSTCFVECKESEFRCKNHRCIRQRLVCNGRDDCDDKSDEADCPPPGTIPSGPGSGSKKLRGSKNIANRTTTTVTPQFIAIRSDPSCPSDQYWCLSGECVPFDSVCNRISDCIDGSDEGDHCDDECGLANECSHQCNKTPQGPVCSCPVGYRLSKNLKSCEDIDECSMGKVCHHICQNVKGSFKCTCREDYILKPDHVTCKAKSNSTLKDNSTVKRPLERPFNPESDEDDNTVDDSRLDGTRSAVPISTELEPPSSHMVVVTTILVILAIIAVIAIGGFVYYQRNGQRKIPVPYVQTWVKYVNDPVQRWRNNRREPLTNENAYVDVYNAESEQTYANPVYEEIHGSGDHRGGGGGGGKVKLGLPRSQGTDSGIMTLMDNEQTCVYSDFEDDDGVHDGHYTNYSQHDKLLDKEFV